MKTNSNAEHSKNKAPWFAKYSLLLILCIASVLLGCDSGPEPDDDEGIIGTGILLHGTVEDTLLANGGVIEAYSSDGKRDVIAINSDRSFNTDKLNGLAPWLLRVQINSNKELFGIAYADGTRNINSYSDAALRRALALSSLTPDLVLNTSSRAGLLPRESDYDDSLNSITDLIRLVLDSYGVTGTDLVGTSYITDDTGIDAFLKRNNLVIDKDNIVFQITDPLTNIKTEQRSATSLTSNFIDNGEGPSQPANVRALSGGMNDVVLVWDAAIDDISVAGYVILRDGQLLGTTPFPAFTDEGLDSNQTYSYVVTAIDSAGNSSMPSLPTIGSSAQPVPTNAPLGASNLALVSASSNTIRMGWSAPADASVVSYNLYRGVLSTNLTLLQQVSATTALDTAIASGLTYCYQVSAVNIVGRESRLSDIVCADSAESTIPETTVSLDDWNIPNTDVDCADILNSTDVPVGLTTLSSGCYIVPQTLEIRVGATLQIDAGVILKFGEDAYISVKGTLTVLGLHENPVVFTGQTEVPGFWGGVVFDNTNTENNILQGVVVQYGGSGSINGAIASRFNTRFSMNNTLVQFNEGNGLALNTEMLQLSSFKGNLIYKNEYPGQVIASSAHSLAGSTRYVDNEVNEFAVLGVYFNNQNIVIPDLGIPIGFSGMEIVNGSLTILPGVDADQLPGSSIEVDGPVIMNGEPDRPITLRGRRAGQIGSWEGLRLTGRGNKVLNYVNIANAGGSGVDKGAVEIDCNNDSSVNVTITNTDISNSASWGIYYKGGACSINIGETVTYRNNAVGDTNI